MIGSGHEKDTCQDQKTTLCSQFSSHILSKFQGLPHFCKYLYLLIHHTVPPPNILDLFYKCFPSMDICIPHACW